MAPVKEGSHNCTSHQHFHSHLEWTISAAEHRRMSVSTHLSFCQG